MNFLFYTFIPCGLILRPVSCEMFVFNSEFFDQLSQFRLLRRVRLDLLEPSVGEVEVGVAAVGHRPVEHPVKLVDVH